MKGLKGQVLEVDLGTGASRRRSIPEELWRRFLGGAGMAARLFFEEADPRVDPLGPDNPLLVMLGPLAGSGVPGSSRFSICARSPLTGLWGESSCGGNLAVEMRAAGLDGVIVRGRAAEPVVLCLDDGRVELRPAGALWGLDTYQTVDALKPSLGPGREPKVLCIGQAGERLVRYAAVCHDKHDFAGRTGMGAVMGAKRLKAMVVRGSQPFEAHDPAALKALRLRLFAQIKESVPAESLKQMGTDSTMDLSMIIGDVPLKNYRLGEALEVSAAIGGPTMTERFLVKPDACLHCPIACRRVMKNDEPGPYQVETGPGPEYETCASFGALCMNSDAASLLKINEMCNRYGFDTITGGCTVAFAIDCVEQGILSRDEVDGLELGWGNAEAILALVHKIGLREGVGDLLAEGSREAARRIGRGAEALTAEVKGLELPMHDPRGSHGMGLAYMMSSRGACHNAHLMHPVEQGMASWPELGFAPDYQGQVDEGKAAAVKLAEDYGAPLAALCMCVFDNWTFKAGDPVEALNAVTGWGFSVQDYLQAGARIWLLRRALINLMGATAADDRLPAKVLTPTAEGGAVGSVPDTQKLLREYYELRGLDAQGRPTRETLAAAELADVAARLHGPA
ncbi:MAG TPA: aldehyde ferredoxin oxidoreductase family protein [Myxococcota bacterium]|nr:aldehyde ferredoxin oxidoreductase family protein [Myxococcota bacterium]HRY94856.1 aldehyde ferredoxin oxidoreductase family protein [Myxococcota bacterium]